jgi:hypothetical protein
MALCKKKLVGFLPAALFLAFALMLGVVAVSPFVAFAQAQATISINPNLPGVYSISTDGPCGWIVNFYNFALILSGILAFGAVVYGGFLYSTSAGNAHKQSEGTSFIWSALLGLLLLGGAYLILKTVNPALVKCSLPTLSGVNVAATTGGGGGVGSGAGNSPGGQPTSGNCASGQCQTLPNCTQSSRVNCGGAAGMVSTLSCIQQKDPNFTVSEGYPPTVQHTSAGHSNGCSVDTVVPNGCAGVQQLLNAAAQCGATTLNEYSGCNGKVYGTTTGNNVHINAVKGAGGC